MRHLLDRWASIISEYEQGQHVMIDHPEMDQEVGGTINGHIMQTDMYMVEIDNTDGLVSMVPGAMMRVGVKTSEYALSWEGLISVAEQIMERGSLAGRVWNVPEGHRDDPEYQKAMQPLEDFVSKVMGERTSIYTSAYTLGRVGNPQAMVTSVGSIVVQPVTNDMIILHECAHLIRRTMEGQSHDEDFARTARDLYSKYISKEAGDAFWEAITMTGRVSKTAATNWRALVSGDKPFWKQHDFTIATQMRGRQRYFTLWVMGELFRNYQRLDDAKVAVEVEFGSLDWQHIQMPKATAYHYYFGWTSEFTDPANIYVADIEV